MGKPKTLISLANYLKEDTPQSLTQLNEVHNWGFNNHYLVSKTKELIDYDFARIDLIVPTEHEHTYLLLSDKGRRLSRWYNIVNAIFKEYNGIVTVLISLMTLAVGEFVNPIQHILRLLGR